jgi:hypothetical protein
MGIFICQKQSVRCRDSRELPPAPTAAVEYLRKIKENITFSTPAVTYKQGARAHTPDVKGTLFERQKEESPAECVCLMKRKNPAHTSTLGEALAGWLLCLSPGPS